MIKNPKQCPYFIKIGHQAISCQGAVAGGKIRIGYAKPGAEKVQYADYCVGNYQRCEIAQMVNSVRHEYEVYVCPYNAEVECLHNNRCNRCGWNPEISKQRLEQLFV